MAHLIGVVPQRGRQASAIAVVQAEGISSSRREKDCAARHLETGALGGTHKQLIDRVGELHQDLRWGGGDGPSLVRAVLDGTTLEEASLRLWRGQAYRPRIYEVGTTAHPVAKPGAVPVTRRQLFDLLNVALQAPRLRVARTLELTPELYRQLAEPRLLRPPAPGAPGDFDADEITDNLALAVALAVWEADHSQLEASPPGPIVARTDFNPYRV